MNKIKILQPEITMKKRKVVIPRSTKFAIEYYLGGESDWLIHTYHRYVYHTYDNALKLFRQLEKSDYNVRLSALCDDGNEVLLFQSVHENDSSTA